MNTLPAVGKECEPAEAAATHWNAIAAALTPVIGAQGFSALFRRSLHLAKGRFPALASVADLGPPFLSLRDALSGLSDPDARDAQAGLFQTLQELLAKLIGPQLTERLLPSPCTDSSLSEQPSAQDRRL
jgi:hypothetical protein